MSSPSVRINNVALLYPGLGQENHLAWTGNQPPDDTSNWSFRNLYFWRWRLTEGANGPRRWRIVNCFGIAQEIPIGFALRAILRIVPKGLTVPILQGLNRGFRWIVGAGTHGFQIHREYCELLMILGYRLVSLDGANVTRSNEIVAFQL